MGPYGHIGSDLGPWMHLSTWVDTYKSYYLFIFLRVSWMSQDILIHLLVVAQVYLLGKQQLLSFLGLLPEVLGLIQNVEIGELLITQGLNQILDLYLFCAILNLELIREFIETTQIIKEDKIILFFKWLFFTLIFGDL